MPTIDEVVNLSNGAPHEDDPYNLGGDDPQQSTWDWDKFGKNLINVPKGDRPDNQAMTESAFYIWGMNVEGAPFKRGRIYMRNAQLDHLSESQGWLTVQTQANGFTGAYFDDMATNHGSGAMVFTQEADGSLSFLSPPQFENGHAWMARSQVPADIKGSVLVCEMRIDDPDCNVIYGLGLDWWKPASGWVQGEANNQEALLGTAIKLTTQWRWVGLTSMSKAELEANPPAILTASIPEDPPVPETVGYTATIAPVAACHPGETIRMEAAIAANNATSVGTRHVVLLLYRMSNNTQVVTREHLNKALTQTPLTIGSNYVLPANLTPGQYKVIASVQTGTFSWLPVTQTPAVFEVTAAVEPDPDPVPTMTLNVSGQLVKGADGQWTANISVVQ